VHGAHHWPVHRFLSGFPCYLRFFPSPLAAMPARSHDRNRANLTSPNPAITSNAQPAHS